MHGHSWRSRVAAHLAPVKEYLPNQGHFHIHHHHHHHHNPPTETGCADGDAKKHTWSHLASRMFARRSYTDPDAMTSTERVVLLPGWASRRYRAGPELSSRTGASCRFLFKEKSLMVRRCPVRHRGVCFWLCRQAQGPQHPVTFPTEYTRAGETLAPLLSRLSVRAEYLIRYRFPPEAARSTSRRCRGPPPA
jgi:hypothetical protein